jgi:hypothetical protein
MTIPQSFIQELVARADVVDIVGRYVQLKKGGANFMGLCPFHAEKSPSFTVSPTKQFYHCFGCGKHGDAINFLMEQTGMSFIEAVRDLAQHYGLQVPEDEASPQDRARAAEQRQKQATLSDVLERAGEAWRRQLKNSPRACPAKSPGNSAWATPRRVGAAWPASSRSTTTRCSWKAAWSSPALTTTAARKSATTASATASCSRSATSRANASALADVCWATRNPNT